LQVTRGLLLGMTDSLQGRPAWRCPCPQVVRGHDPEHEAEPRLRLRPQRPGHSLGCGRPV